MLLKKTLSFCPTCYKKIPADILVENDSVYIQKTCSEHGDFKAMVERDAGYYLQCLSAGTRIIYPGYFLDVTRRCNLKCKYCYYGVENSKDPSIQAIIQEAQVNAHLAPFIITGGEPTLREDLSEIISCLKQIGPVELLTNGTKLDLEKVVPLLRNNDVLNINLSMHPESNGKDLEIIEQAEKMGCKLESVLFVIDKVEQIDGILSFCKGRGIEAVRIKAATKLWAENKPENKIFVSDMMKYMQKYNPESIWWRNNKTSFFNTRIDGIFYMLVSWYDAYNVDLLDINCPPFYTAKTGQIENIVTAALINEGMQKGYLYGRKING